MGTYSTFTHIFLVFRATILTHFAAVESSIYFFHVVRPDYLSYSYEIQLARNIGLDFSRQLKSVQLVYASPDNACSPLTNTEEIKGSVVLIERG
jgi:hypothetical protein